MNIPKSGAAIETHGMLNFKQAICEERFEDAAREARALLSSGDHDAVAAVWLRSYADNF